MAERRLISEAISALRVVDHNDWPLAYVEEARKGNKELKPGYVRHRMLGTPNVTTNIDVAM